MKRDRTTDNARRQYRDHYDIEHIFKRMYSKQKARAKTHSYKTVEYSQQDFIAWGLNQPNVYELFNTWIKSGHKKRLKPSVDRIDAARGYSFDNIQLLTWEENDIKGKHENSTVKAVLQFTKDGEFIAEWSSAVEASKAIAPHLKNHNKSKIYMVLNNKPNYNTFYGYKFTYKEAHQ